MKDRIRLLNNFEPEMFEDHEGPHVSIYLSTQRDQPENREDKIKLKTLIAEAEASLAEKYSKSEYKEIIEDLRQVENRFDREFWQLVKEGLAILAHSDRVYMYILDYPVTERVVVSDDYHIKPLIRNFQYGSCYYLLDLSADRFDLYRGDRHALAEVTLPEDVKHEFKDLFNDFDNGATLNTGSFSGKNAGFFSYETKSATVERETVKFFHYVGGVVEDYLKEHQPHPLILVSLTQHQTPFREASDISCLFDQGIEKPFKSMSKDELISEATTLIKACEDKAINIAIDDYGILAAKEQASSDPSTIAQALVERKLTTLLVERDRLTPGTYDSNSGRITIDSTEDPTAEDLANIFALATYLQGGRVYVLDGERMPSKTGFAALFRY